MGYPVFYSDREAKWMLENDPEIRNQLIVSIGDSAYNNGKLNTKYLSEKIFNDSSLREKVNGIVHPAVRERFRLWAEEQNSPLVFNEAAILFETGAFQQMDATILVTAPEALKVERVMKRDHCDKQTVLNRMAAQWSDHLKKEKTNLILVNDDHQPLLEQIEKVLLELAN